MAYAGAAHFRKPSYSKCSVISSGVIHDAARCFCIHFLAAGAGVALRAGALPADAGAADFLTEGAGATGALTGGAGAVGDFLAGNLPAGAGSYRAGALTVV